MKRTTAVLLEWYRQNRILYPWRLTSDPYKIWLSEILLQQTRIPVALPFFTKIVEKYPSIEDVARASQESFAADWSGIGYYGRAKNMHACARELVSNHKRKFPSSFEQLIKLPGIGRYTAGALRNLCFAELTPAIDGNVARVLSRLTLNVLPPESKDFLPAIEKSFLRLGKNAPAPEYFQALMELGEQICSPRPLCSLCPVRNFCSAHKAGMENQVPRTKARKITVPYFWYFLLLRKSGSLYLIKNSNRAFLREAWLFPDVLDERKLTDPELISEFQNRWNIGIRNLNCVGSVAHSVTYRKIQAIVIQPEDFSIQESTGKWISRDALTGIHTSSVFKKVLKLFR